MENIHFFAHHCRNNNSFAGREEMIEICEDGAQSVPVHYTDILTNSRVQSLLCTVCEGGAPIKENNKENATHFFFADKFKLQQDPRKEPEAIKKSQVLSLRTSKIPRLGWLRLASTALLHNVAHNTDISLLLTGYSGHSGGCSWHADSHDSVKG